MQATPREMAELEVALNERIGHERQKSFDAGRDSVPKFDQVETETVRQVRQQLFDQMSQMEKRNQELESQLENLSKENASHPIRFMFLKGNPITIDGHDCTIMENYLWEVGSSPPLSLKTDMKNELVNACFQYRYQNNEAVAGNLYLQDLLIEIDDVMSSNPYHSEEVLCDKIRTTLSKVSPQLSIRREQVAKSKYSSSSYLAPQDTHQGSSDPTTTKTGFYEENPCQEPQH